MFLLSILKTPPLTPGFSPKFRARLSLHPEAPISLAPARPPTPLRELSSTVSYPYSPPESPPQPPATSSLSYFSHLRVSPSRDPHPGTQRKRTSVDESHNRPESNCATIGIRSTLRLREDAFLMCWLAGWLTGSLACPPCFASLELATEPAGRQAGRQASESIFVSSG